ncbi:CBS and ACT domain-containing protein [Phocicoccus pinnipedialis]|uniref:Inosine 5'-monophosphate dehydrogenase n=1 Tax=Phocicoccus pinnipedialis TaxID=110845 RepID=A0A6V7RBH9_9BACL|nr:CBS and ACT domain-containing protein [Jeotgalicoccus pinnipedialis]MBP1939539.1 acetoin utilization protein AcuB [Jeotgalicoccus pinnipedialis]CAD2074993.1 inosine 5'-monophosphate dehydrogenase [Jeotgalicoccus pinnipedialis]
MLVKTVMTENVKTLKETDTIESAITMMNAYNIRHIPIVDDERHVVGLVTDKDINLALPSILSKETNVTMDHDLKEIMKKNIISTSEYDFVEELAVDFHQFDLGAVPVVKNRKLIGIVTQTDIMSAFIEITGMKHPGSIIEIDVFDKPGIVHDIGHTMKELNTRIVSITIYDNREKPNHKVVVLKINAMNPQRVIEALVDKGFDVVNPYRME